MTDWWSRNDFVNTFYVLLSDTLGLSIYVYYTWYMHGITIYYGFIVDDVLLTTLYFMYLHDLSKTR